MTWEMYEALVDACDRVDADRAGARVRPARRRRQGVRRRHRHQPVHAVSRRARTAIAYERRIDAVIDRLERVQARDDRPGRRAWRPAAAARSRWPATCASARRRRGSACRSRGRSATACRPRTTRGSSISSGRPRVKDLLFTGRLIDAREARALGLVTRMAESGEHRRRRARAGGDDRRQRAADHPRDQGSAAPHPGAPPARRRTRPTI